MRLSMFGLMMKLILLLAALGSVARADTKTCLECHGDPSLTRQLPGGKQQSLYADLNQLKASVHGEFECADCHADLKAVKDIPHAEHLQKVNCGECHGDAATAYTKSLHYKISRLGQEAPTCLSCHGRHDILAAANPKSRTNKSRLTELCGPCHGAPKPGPSAGLLPDILTNYTVSVHHKAILSGNLKAASCIDCHGTHDLRSAGDPGSNINRWKIPSTCSRCHERVYQDFMGSIHGQAFTLGITSAPICTDCHGEHAITGRDSAGSATFDKKLSFRLCLDCHSNPKMLAKFGRRLGNGASFVDSYHGLSLNLGGSRAATCVSCHGVHKILPPGEPASTIAPANLTKTCGQCHPGASASFTRSYTHAAASSTESGIVAFIKSTYIILIVLVIGGMILHNLVILLYYFRKKYRLEKEKPTLTRFNLQEILQHVLLSAAFIILVITGFALKFSNTTVFQFLLDIGLTENLRSVIHRAAAVVLLATGVWHLLYLALTGSGRAQLRALMFFTHDLRLLAINLKHHLMLTKEKPLFGQYDYSEKAEYWALVWGTVIMALTGFVLWFPVFFTRFLPFWVVKVSETIHYYEAILATLAIVFWHFFFVIMHPEEYPMNLSWLTGKITLDLAEEKYPLWTHRMLTQRKQTAGPSPSTPDPETNG